MNDDDDVHDVDERLARIESQVTQIKLLLGVLVVIALIGLPGVLSAVVEIGLFGLLVIVVGGAVVCGLYYLLDFLFLRHARTKRDAALEKELNEVIQAAKAEKRA